MDKGNKNDKKKSFFGRLMHFLSFGIWKVDGTKESKIKLLAINIVKVIILTFRNIDTTRIFTRASALTFSTLLSIVPMLAILFGIANGFGFHETIKGQLAEMFKGQEDVLDRISDYIDKSIEYTHEGIFIGVGLLFLLYSAISLLSDIENSFNKVWSIEEGRSFYRMFTDYMSLLIIAPIFLICSAGIQIFLSSADMGIITIVFNPFLKIIPYLITTLLFTLIYIYIPNTRVKFWPAFAGGVFTGVIFQIFQMLYISGQIWISKYNAIYGSFAALPLLLLWLQLTWFLTLVGLEISFATQNISKFSYEYEVKNISLRYKDFVTLMVATLIIKRFAHAEKALTSDEISQEYGIPTKLNTEILNLLEKVGLIDSIKTQKDKVYAFSPAIDINLITVDYFFNKIKSFGSEDFPIDTKKAFKDEWELVKTISNFSDIEEGNKLLKDM